MMNRREFLQASAASMLAGLPAWRVCHACAAHLPLTARGLHFGLKDGIRVTAAAFHSDLWGVGSSTGGYDLFTLPSLHKKYDATELREINGRFGLDEGARSCDVFVALAHPGDPTSLNAALEHCEIAKRTGAFTLLLAAEAFPDPEYDQTDQPRFFDRQLHLKGLPQPDAIFNFMTLEPYMEMVNVASLFSLNHEILHNVDLADIRTIFDGKSDTVMLEGGAFGPGQGYRAATEVCRYIERGTLAGRPVKGAFISFVVDRANWKLAECCDALYVFTAALKEGCPIIVAWVPLRGDESDFMGITALVTV